MFYENEKPIDYQGANYAAKDQALIWISHYSKTLADTDKVLKEFKNAQTLRDLKVAEVRLIKTAEALVGTTSWGLRYLNELLSNQADVYVFQISNHRDLNYAPFVVENLCLQLIHLLVFNLEKFGDLYISGQEALLGFKLILGEETLLKTEKRLNTERENTFKTIEKISNFLLSQKSLVDNETYEAYQRGSRSNGPA